MITVLSMMGLMAAPSASELTVYNQGLGFVKEVRAIKLKKGTQTVAVENVAARIDTTSVGFKCLSKPGSVSVLEQNYQYDLISPAAILGKSVGKKIRFTRTMGTQKESVEGILLSSPTSVNGNDGTMSYNGLVMRTNDGRIILSPQGEIEVMEIPEGLISKPTLIWEMDSEADQNADIELSYLTSGMSWNANYVLTLDKSGKADLQGWVTMTNNSGISFKDTKLKFLAGDVNMVQPPRVEFAAMMADGGARRAKNEMKEESLFEYHLYTLERPATVRDKEAKQLSLLEGFDVPVTKEIIFDSMTGFGTYYPSEGEVGVGDLSPQVKVRFVNDKKSNLGQPMPAGKIRLYQRDESGSVQFIGEDQINHTPQDETLKLTVGRSFDIRASRKRTEFKRMSDRSFRETFEIEVRNRKKVAESVVLLERHWGDWKVTEKSAVFTKADANTMQFDLSLKAGEVRKVTYTVETRW